MSLYQNVYDYIKSGETDTENLGLEIEHFIVDENGVQIGFDEVTSLIDRVGRELGAEIIYTDGYSVGYTIEKYGHNAVIYHNVTAAQWAERLVVLASERLPEHEKEYLADV